jgi:predicted DNA binding CopG/RHH family protein
MKQNNETRKQLEKPATLSINKHLLVRIKVYCSQRGMKIYAWAEKVLNTALEKGE